MGLIVLREKSLWKTRNPHFINTYSFTFLSIILLLSLYTETASGWGNGGYSDDPSNPDYGTHDWIAQHALNWLPSDEKAFILDALTIYLYGTEMPDNNRAPDGIGDTTKHHVYYRANGFLQDDASAVRAQEEFELAVSLYRSGNIKEAVKRLGAMTHYISDMAVFAHVMGASTDWGKEVHHSDYENYVNEKTNSYYDEFNTFLRFDGTLEEISAYDAALRLAYDTTFDTDGNLSCVWMDRNYDWSSSIFRNRCGESLNLAVNLVADVLHTFYLTTSLSSTATVTFYANGLSGDATGNILIVDGVSYSYSDIPKSFTWSTGSTHSFKWINTVSAVAGKRYVWASTCGLSQNSEDSIKVPPGGGNVTATYGTKYYLTMRVEPSDGGSVSPSSGWYSAGSTLEISVIPKPSYKFIGWAGSGFGSYNGSDNPAIITMNSPIVETAFLETFDFAISLTTGNGTIEQGGNIMTTINVTLLRGSPTVVSLSTSGLPSGVSLSLAPNISNPSFTSFLEIKVSESAPLGTFTIGIEGRGNNLTRTTTYVLTIKARPSQDINTIVLPLALTVFLAIVILLFKRR